MKEIWKRDEINSPCVKICIIHHKYDLCIGCYRSLSEISEWSQLESEDRKKVILDIPNRKLKMINKRKGGRKKQSRD
jgi:predicted Fe-S protein YdhL (DUF1289 family)